MKRVLSGMQASGKLHIGNLVGALANWARIQEDYECFYFVADWHALTTGYAHPEDIKASTQDLLINFLAAGLDPEKCTIFKQSQVLQHAELHLMLSMITPLGWLERVPTYKEKKENLAERDLSMYGFLGYPVLQSADILIYKADFVPVGVDQVPHLEITREIARRFNHLYKTELFPEPEALLTDFPKVTGTDGRKMSKSYDNALYLSDNAKTMDKKIRSMQTDPARMRKTDKGDPAKCPVFDLHKVFSTETEQAECAEGCRTAGIGCIDCKQVLIKHIMTLMEPIWENRAHIMDKPQIITDALESGNKRATQVSEWTMQKVRKKMGF
jgi:tryptophanyl-tRNA synthetase